MQLPHIALSTVLAAPLLAVDFGALQTIDGAAFFPTQVRAADLDEDGLADVLVGSLAGGEVTWYRGLGGGGFGPRQVLGTVGAHASDLLPQDFDGDGDLDVYASNGVTLFCFQNLGGGTFGAPAAWSTPVLGLRSLESGDLDGDGLRDLIAGGLDDGAVAWWRNLGQGAFGPTQLASVGGQGCASVASGDLDGDGDLNLVSAHTLD
jgi:hypothetical protein